ncbi:hypothetical protein [Psychroserpens algicola]|uniref:hypothetical protein n=1 Tax=Psychroserpens algicola TaxID=1719034 RepID=UPI001953E84A|nr:hypothetical protein [Psychroserpens algicola]
MANIKKIRIDDEWYCSINDVLKLMKDTNDIDDSIRELKKLNTIVVKARGSKKEDEPELSDFNKKLKKGLDWNPKKEG